MILHPRMIDAGWSRPAEQIYIDDREMLVASPDERRMLDRLLARPPAGIEILRLHGYRDDVLIRFAAQIPCVTSLPTRVSHR